MNLEGIKGEYDAVFSLGDLCLTSIELQKNNLRPFSGVLDWSASPSLKDVTRLLKNRFAQFMDLEHLKIIGYAGDHFICVLDETYSIVSNHDFERSKNSLFELTTYKQVKEKYDRRIKRFLEAAAFCKRILFVRTEGTYEEVIELESVLSQLVTNDFNILLINHTDANGIIERHWPIERVCAVDFPDTDKWYGNEDYWKTALAGIKITV
ncbi:DUF1796 family putative cysteine peptidase [Fictibacillus terranigra]|uniref:DUF1796 family putative cysteine peptidase n=1 Tax=Fictibacillus terranigra TaxID=3058424 RepID=A0ABT8E6X1_9BACL|nr:DUF1796 family putative cysteine peptidase [Fictibacillus sp. CENA-BCM004]MDN4073661.1 DUF1796 family putative cysteine peptidase [Fictibacillus sp. CENA-BCM004]